MGTLTALRVKNAKPGEKLGDGEGLRLDVDKNGNAQIASHQQRALYGAWPLTRRRTR